MKFARLLRATAFEGMPQMETLFSAYKSLKKKIKKLPHKEQLGPQGAPDALTEEETEFVQALSDTLNQLNDIYIEKEETSVIRVERLESELAAATTPQQFNELHKQFVDFHGEVLLLVHWSILAYTATVKILKKHHKRTGLLVRAPQLGNLLSQPFCSTELMTSIARRVEEDIQRLSEHMGLPTQRASEPSNQQALRHPAQQGSERLGTPSTGAAAMAAAAAAAAAAAGAGGSTAAGPMGHEAELDLQLMRQLAAESGSQTSRSDEDESAEQDTCASKQQQQPCSQQANLQQAPGGDEDPGEVQSAPKRRRAAPPESLNPLVGAAGSAYGLHPAAQPAAAHAALVACQHAPAAAGAGVVLGARCPAGIEHQGSSNHRVPAQQQQQLQELADEAQQQPDQHMAAAAVETAAAATADVELRDELGMQDCAELQDDISMQGPGVAMPAQSGSRSGSGLADSGEAAGGSCARQASIMRQTQVALTTWRHLQSTASTPSTVMQGQGYNQSEAALTASSAVQ